MLTKDEDDKLNAQLRVAIRSIRLVLAYTADELRSLKRHRHEFDGYLADQYAILKRRASVLHVALRMNRLLLGGNENVNAHRPHMSTLVLQGPWYGSLHLPTPDDWRPRVRPARKGGTPSVERRPNTQPQRMVVTTTALVNWTKMVNDWVACCGYKARAFHIDITIDSYIQHHQAARRALAHQARQQAAEIRGNAPLN